MKKDWVLIKKNNGTLAAWRDYGTAWGSPIYTVLGFSTGSYREAISEAKRLVRLADEDRFMRNAAEIQPSNHLSPADEDTLFMEQRDDENRRAAYEAD